MLNMRFRTKVDWWLGLIMGVAIVVYLWLMITAGDMTVFLWALLPILIIVGLCYPCDYTFTEDKLVVRSGLIKWRIPYTKIYRVKPTHNPLSSPAWSLDRLMIYYGKIWVMVSPERRNEFLAELIKRTGLTKRGNELVMPD